MNTENITELNLKKNVANKQLKICGTHYEERWFGQFKTHKVHPKTNRYYLNQIYIDAKERDWIVS